MTLRVRFKICAAALAFSALCSASAWAADTPPADASSRGYQQVKGIIEAHGFYGVRELSVDASGVWSAQATKYDQRWLVEVDERGNFTGLPNGARGDLRSPSPARKRVRPQLFLILK